MITSLHQPERNWRCPGWVFLFAFLLLTSVAWGQNQNLRIGSAANDCPAFVEVPVTFVQPDGSPVTTMAFEFTYDSNAFQEQYFGLSNVSNRPLVLRGAALLTGNGLGVQVISSKLSGTGTPLAAGIWRVSLIQPSQTPIPGGELLRLRFYPIAGSPVASYPINFNPGSVMAFNAVGAILPPLTPLGGAITLLPCPGTTTTLPTTTTTTLPPTTTTLPPTTTTTTLPPTTTTLPPPTTTTTTLPPTTTTLPPTTTTLPPTTTTLPPTTTTLPPTTTTLPPTTTTLPPTTTTLPPTTTTLPPTTTTTLPSSTTTSTTVTTTTVSSTTTTTTLPVFGPSAVLEFPQLAVGAGYRAFLLIENPNVSATQVGISLRNSFGQSLNVLINGVLANSYAGTIPAQGVVRLRLEDNGNLIRTGWCQVFANRPITGVLVFQLMSGADILAEASVLPAPRYKKFSLLVPQLGSFTETGLALANPDDSPSSIVLRRLTNDGLVVSETAFSLGPGEQIARFISQFFPGGVAALEGRVEILSSRPILSVGLLYQNTSFTTIPVVPLP